MSRRDEKTAMYEQFARAGKALSSPKRLELLDLLAQGERTVEALAQAADLGLSTASQHLQALKDSGFVRARREGTFMRYRLAGDDVAALFALLRTVATTHLADAERAVADYLGETTREMDPVEREELLRRARTGDVVILDVRPSLEFEAGHIPGAVSVPLNELEECLDETARRRRGRRLLPRRLLRPRPGRGPDAGRDRSPRSATARGDARVAAGRTPGPDRCRMTTNAALVTDKEEGTP